MQRINLSFYILILSTVIVSLIVIRLLYKISPLFTSENLFVCQKSISDIMFKVPPILVNTLILAIGVVLGIGLLSFLLQLVKTHFLLKKLLIKRLDIPSNLAKVLKRINLVNKVILVKDKNLFSFCYGIFFPSIMLSTGLTKSLTEKELEAVLLHEQSHLINRDPTKILLGKTFSLMFFFLPILRELYKKMEATSELLADEWTINRQETSAFLRAALKKILAAPQLDLKLVSRASGPDYFEIRVHRLLNPKLKYKFRLSLVNLSTTLLFIAASWFLLQTPVDAFHKSAESNSSFYLCSSDQSCSRECPPDSGQLATYILKCAD